MTNQIKNLGLGVNKKQLLNLLSASLYKGDVLNVSTRELVQNAFDAVKTAQEQVINIHWDYSQKRLTVQDSGQGMSPQIVQDVFLTIGGTNKDGLDAEDRSGGFGIAKVQFFMAAERITVNTVHNGIKTVLDCSKEDLLDERASLIITKTTEPNGSVVSLKFPEEYTDSSGVVKRPYYWKSSIESVLKHPLLGYNNIVVSLDAQIQKYDIPQTYFTQEYEWGKVQIYLIEYNGRSNNTVHYHCAGLYQFTDTPYVGNPVGIECRINILPKYPAGHSMYPFANSRDALAYCAKQSLKSIENTLKEIGTKCRSLKIAEEYSAFVPLKYTKGMTHIEAEKNPNFNSADVWAKALKESGSIQQFLELLSKAAEVSAKRQAAREESFEANKKDSLKLINKIGIHIDDTLYSVCCNIASVVYDTLYKINIEYSRRPTIAGIIFDRSCKGCCLTLGGTKGIYLNPLGKYYSTEHFACIMVDTLVHEFAHGFDSNEGHYDRFFELEAAIWDIIHRDGLYASLMQSFRDIYKQYSEILNK